MFKSQQKKEHVLQTHLQKSLYHPLNGINIMQNPIR